MSESKQKSISVPVRISEAVSVAIDKAVKESPIEFQNRSDFVRRAIEAELRRRGMIKQYK